MRNVLFGAAIALLSACKGKEGPMPAIGPVQDSLRETDTVISATEAPKKGKDRGVFLKFDQNGDDYQVIAVTGKDTTAYLYNAEEVPFMGGDIVEISWKQDVYIPEGDREHPVTQNFVTAIRLVKQGRQAALVKGGFLNLTMEYGGLALSDYGKEEIEQAIRYYLSHTSKPDVVKIVQANKEIYCWVEKEDADSREIYEVRFSLTEDDPKFFEMMYFSFGTPFTLYEYGHFYKDSY